MPSADHTFVGSDLTGRAGHPRSQGKELGLTDPFEADAPVHPRYSTDIKQMPQAAE